MNQIISVKVKDLELDLENPRLHAPKSQREAIAQILSTGKDAESKHLNLARDILQNGLNPTDLIIVGDPNEKGKRIVFEGNRRLCAMLCILNPDYLEGISARLKRAFSDMDKKKLAKTITCSEMSRVEARPWIAKKHLGQNEGRGTLTWSSLQKARWDYLTNGIMTPHIAIQSILDGDEEGMIAFEESNTTTVIRIVESVPVQEFVGFSWRNKCIVSALPLEELRFRLISIIKATPEVKEVYTDSLAFMWVSRTFPHFKDKPKELDRPAVASVTPTKGVTSVAATVPASLKPVYSRKPRAPKYGLDRKYLIIKGSLNGIPPATRVANIYIELSERLEVNLVANACAVLFRSFIELTLSSFMREQRLPNFKEIQKDGHSKKVDLALKEKLNACIDHLSTLYPVKKKELATVKQTISSTPIYQIKDMNGFVHDPDYHPDPSSLKSTWDNIKVIFDLIYHV